LNLESYEYIQETYTSDVPEELSGWITSYNSNTFKGRIYVPDIGRPVAFELAEHARTRRAIAIITSSLSAAALNKRGDPRLMLRIAGLRNSSQKGHLKSFTVLDVRPNGSTF
jgi:hypothetical protein